MKRISGGSSINSAAAKVGMEQSTLNRQMKSSPTPETVVRVARAFGANPVAGLVQLGLVTAQEAGAENLVEAAHLEWIKTADDAILLEEIGRRIASRSEAVDLD